MAKRKTLIRTLAVVLLAFISTAAFPQAVVRQYLLVTESDGTETSFALADAPVITLDGGMLTVASAARTLSVAIADVADYKFVMREDIPTAITNAETAAEALFSLSGGKACVAGLAPGTQVGVYAVDGTRVAAAVAGSDGTVAVDLGALGHGTVYILRTPAASYKVLNK